MARERFLGILRHDLRNPLGATMMGATLLKGSPGEDPVEIATAILNGGLRMSRMVSDLLDLTRTRLGSGIPVSLKRMDLTSVCDQVLAELRPTHPRFELIFTAEGDLSGEWDGDRIAQVISNLVRNAIQHGGDGSPITVAAVGKGDEVVLEVHNGGPHMAKRLLTTIFEPMMRHAGDEHTNPGLGLGLYIASQVATAHGGTIKVTSTSEEGTTFTVHLPRHAPAKPVVPSRVKSRHASSSATS